MDSHPLSATGLAHLLMAEVLSPGDRCIDATAGNGHDTVFLRRQVGAQGEVMAIDIQETALNATRCRLREMGLAEGCRLILDDHSRLAMIAPQSWRGHVRVICFNLGYLPGGDKLRTTSTSSTMDAMRAALELLAPGGLLSVTAYPGHQEGARECAAVAEYLTGLPSSCYTVYRYSVLNTVRPAPVVHLVSRSMSD